MSVFELFLKIHSQRAGLVCFTFHFNENSVSFTPIPQLKLSLTMEIKPHVNGRVTPMFAIKPSRRQPTNGKNIRQNSLSPFKNHGLFSNEVNFMKLATPSKTLTYT